MRTMRFLFIFAACMLFAAGVFAQFKSNFGVAPTRTTDTSVTGGTIQSKAAADNGTRISYWDNLGNLLNGPTDMFNYDTTSLSDRIDGKAPIINTSPGTQFVGWIPDLVTPYTVREGLLSMNDKTGVITNWFTQDSTNNHQSQKGQAMVRQSRDGGVTYSAEKVLYNSIYDDRGIGGGQVGDSFITCIGEYTTDPVLLIRHGYVMSDTTFNYTSPLRLIYTRLQGATRGAFGKSKWANDGKLLQAFYQPDSVEIMQWNDTGWKTRLVFGRAGLVEPAIQPITGTDTCFVICRNTQGGGDSAYRRTLWLSTDNFNSIQYLGFLNSDTINNSIYESGGGMIYDTIRKEIIIGWGQRRNLSGKAYADSFSLYRATPLQLAQNSTTRMNMIARREVAYFVNYWYPDFLQIGSNIILGQLTNNFSSQETAQLDKFYINYIDSNSNGGVGLKYGGPGLVATPNPINPQITDYKSPQTVLKITQQLNTGQVFMYYRTKGWVNVPADTLFKYVTAGAATPPAYVYSNGTTIVQPDEYVYKTAGTGFISFKHATIPNSGGILLKMTITGSLYGTPANDFKLIATFYPNTSTAISTAFQSATYEHINGTLPSIRCRASVAPDGQYSFNLFDTTSVIPTGAKIKLEQVEVWNTGVQGITTSFQSGWTITPNNTSIVGHTSVKDIAPMVNGSFSGTSTQSGNGSTTVFNIAHGMGMVPSVFSVTPGSASAAGSYYVTATSTNIVITYTSAPASGTNNLTWKWIAKP